MEWLQKLLGMQGGGTPFGALGGSSGAPGASPFGAISSLLGSAAGRPPGAPGQPPGMGGGPMAGTGSMPQPPGGGAPPQGGPGLPGILGQNQNAANNVMAQAQRLIQGPQMQTPGWMPWMR